MAPEPQELNAVLERLSRLEKQNRRLKWMGVTALAAVSAIFFTGQAAPTPRTVEAQKFVLKDAQGNVRGWMSTIGKGSELTLGNVKAQPMIRLVVSTDSSDLHLFGGPKSGLNLSMDSGNPDISMIAAQGNGEARIAFNEYGPSFTLQDCTNQCSLDTPIIAGRFCPSVQATGWQPPAPLRRATRHARH